MIVLMTFERKLIQPGEDSSKYSIEGATNQRGKEFSWDQQPSNEGTVRTYCEQRPLNEGGFVEQQPTNVGNIRILLMQIKWFGGFSIQVWAATTQRGRIGRAASSIVSSNHSTRDLGSQYSSVSGNQSTREDLEGDCSIVSGNHPTRDSTISRQLSILFSVIWQRSIQVSAATIQRGRIWQSG